MPDTNIDKLRAIQAAHPGLDRYAIADYLGIRKVSVDKWFFRPDAVGYRAMPDHMIKLLEYEIDNK